MLDTLFVTQNPDTHYRQSTDNDNVCLCMCVHILRWLKNNLQTCPENMNIQIIIFSFKDLQEHSWSSLPSQGLAMNIYVPRHQETL